MTAAQPAPTGAPAGTVTDADRAGDPSVWGAAARQPPPTHDDSPDPDPAGDTTHGSHGTDTWTPHRMIADAYAGRPIHDDDWATLCRQWDADEAASLLAQLRAEAPPAGGGRGPDGGGRDGAAPGGGSRGGTGRRAASRHWFRWGRIQEQAGPFELCGPIGRAIIDAFGAPS